MGTHALRSVVVAAVFLGGAMPALAQPPATTSEALQKHTQTTQPLVVTTDTQVRSNDDVRLGWSPLRAGARLRSFGPPGLIGFRDTLMPQSQPPASQRRSWIARNPVLFGALVGAGGGAVSSLPRWNELYCAGGGDEDCLFHGGAGVAFGAGAGAAAGALIGLLLRRD